MQENDCPPYRGTQARTSCRERMDYLKFSVTDSGYRLRHITTMPGSVNGWLPAAAGARFPLYTREPGY